jgi:hypothetical protein
MELKNTELKKFGLSDQQIDELDDYLSALRNEALDEEESNFSLVRANDEETVVRIPSDPALAESKVEAFKQRVLSISGPIGELILPDLQNAANHYTGSFGKFERFIRARKRPDRPDSDKLVYEIIDLQPFTVPSDFEKTDFDELSRLAVHERRALSDDIPKQFSHIFEGSKD